jgi:hypothetical protein
MASLRNTRKDDASHSGHNLLSGIHGESPLRKAKGKNIPVRCAGERKSAFQIITGLP